MNKKFPLGFIIALLLFCGCNSKPSDKDIKKKILLEYVCNETADVNGLTILDTKDAESIAGNKGFEFLVSGEVVWPSGCKEFGTNVPAGFTEKFENKRIFLIKSDNGWQ